MALQVVVSDTMGDMATPSLSPPAPVTSTPAMKIRNWTVCAAHPHRACSRPSNNPTSLTHVLQDVSVDVPFGTTLIVAPPGGGKTTMLRSIGRLELSSERSLTHAGSVTWDSAVLDEFGAVSFCASEDVHLPHLTVRQTLEFAAAVWSSTRKQAEERVQSVVRMLDLESCLDVRVGNADLRGISGGQRRRLSVAESLLSHSNIVLLDEPTTGLDARVAEDVVARLVETCQKDGRVMVQTLQQPSDFMLGLFSNILCLQLGRVVYNGPLSDVVAHFSPFFGPLPPDTEVATWLNDGLATSAVPLFSSPASVCEVAQNGSTRSSQLAVPAPSSVPALKHTKESRPRVTQAGSVLSLLWIRQCGLLWHNRAYLWMHLGQAAVMGAVLGSLFRKPYFLDFHVKFSVVVFSAFLLSFACMPEIALNVAARTVVARQARAGMYRSWMFALVDAVLLLPMACAEVLILGSLVYWLVGFYADAGYFCFFLLCYLLMNLVMNALFRVVAVSCATLQLAQTVAPPLCGILLVFMGFLVTQEHIPGYLIWLYWLSPFSWLLRSIAINEFMSPSSDYATPSPGSSATYGQLFMGTYEIETDGKWKWAGVAFMAGLFVVLQVSAWLIMTRDRAVPPAGTPRHSLQAAARSSTSNLAPASSPLLSTDTCITPHIGNTALGSTTFCEVRSSAATQLTSSPAPTLVTLPTWRTSTQAGLHIHFTGLSYRLTAGGRQWCQRLWRWGLPNRTLTLLDNVCGSLPSGTLTAVIGESGCGKTTMLDVLLGRKASGETRGDLLVNGSACEPRALARVCRYVEQTDLHFPYETVVEALTASARLQVGQGRAVSSSHHLASAGSTNHNFAPVISVEARVQAVIDLLDLHGCAHMMVGDGERWGLFGGVRKRFSIAIELIANPAAIFLDEPTSGLDSTAATDIVQLLRKVAASGVTVCASIHQPTAAMLAVFDQVMVLQTGGRLAYAGPVNPVEAKTDTTSGGTDAHPGMVAYFNSISSTPLESLSRNPATAVLRLLRPTKFSNVTSTPEQHTTYSDAFTRSEAMAEWLKPLVPANSAATPVSTAIKPSQLAIFMFVCTRFSRLQFRNMRYLVGRLGAVLAMAVVFGALYYRLDLSYAGGVQSAISCFFVAFVFVGMVFFSAIIPIHAELHPTLRRELGMGLYGPGALVASIVVTEIPMTLTSSALFSGIFLGMAGLKVAAADYGLFFVDLAVFSLACACLGMLLVSFLGTAYSAQAMGYPLQALLFLFGGLLVRRPIIPEGWLFLFDLNPLQYAVSSAWTSQFYCPDTNTCPVFLISPIPLPLARWEFVRDFLDLRFDDRWTNVAVVLAFAAAFALLAAVGYRYTVRGCR